MSIEIERKFLVKNDEYKLMSTKSTQIIQGYLSTDPTRTVRVRIKGQNAYITIKGKSNDTGTSRYEWEKQIDIEEAKQLLELCLPGIIDKVRYEIISGHHIIEVDEFFGKNEGLTIAEIELIDENEAIVLPSWIGIEVTGDPRYYNSQMIE